MWIVRLALRRPYTFVVVSLLVFILGISAIVTTPKDIFPIIDIPVVSVIWSYTGLSPEEMANRMVTISERAMTTTVNDIEHIESQSYQGVAVIKIFFQPNAKVEVALSQVTALVQTQLRIMPPGTTPPSIVKYDVSSVPVLQMGLSGEGLSEQQLFDFGLNYVRTQLATVQGASVPPPYGGKQAQIMVDLFPDQLYAKHLSPADISNAITTQNLILPTGTAKMGDLEYNVRLNSSPTTIAEMNELPVRAADGAVVLLKDVAQVRSGFLPQINVVRINGSRAALTTILRNGRASTLDIVRKIKAALPRVLASLPPSMRITPLFDQSLFVRAAIYGVIKEATLAALLTGLMILVFLGSWRSTLIVCISIPLSILTSQIVLSAFGKSINVMTLGGMALAVGILVDDATVTIENVHRNMAMRKPLTRALLDGAEQIAVPTLVSSLSICIVFVPVVLLTGAARLLFTPLAMAVVFAMLASYFFSRTLVPTMVHHMLGPEVSIYAGGHHGHQGLSWIWRMHFRFNEWFEKMRERYRQMLEWSLHHRGLVLGGFAGVVVLSALLLVVIGQDFFPYVDSGQMRLHVRCPAGTRVETTEQIFAEVEAEIRRVLPADEVEMILDNIGLPTSGINLAFSDSATIGTADGDILIALNPEKHGSTREYMRRLRERLKERFPQEAFFFAAANMTTQILNFGLPAPVDVQVVGRDMAGNYEVAKRLLARVRQVPGVVDAHIHQEMERPGFDVKVDRAKAQQLGLSQRDVAQSMLISLSGSYMAAPNQWLNPVTGINYQVTVQTPQGLIPSLDAMGRTPVNGPQNIQTTNKDMHLLANLASVSRSAAPTVISHYNVQPVFDLYCDVDRRDLGAVAHEVQKILDQETASGRLPRGSWLVMRGQVETMQNSFFRLGLGIAFAVVFIYLLMAVNFQSWVDPFVILMALPGAFAGILWVLFVTQTTFSVPSLMGTIMSIGVATANSILVVSFANDERGEGKGAVEAALSAGYVRLRPVCMTALAMIIGMIPMAMAMGEGGEQNAPLGRAVIGGLLFATVSTLFIVPIFYSILRKRAPIDWDKRIDREAQAGPPEEGAQPA
jgi:multidrug efflux pump subunit AcrB